MTQLLLRLEENMVLDRKQTKTLCFILNIEKHQHSYRIHENYEHFRLEAG